MFRECPFCHTTHSSAYVDELEAAVLECRNRVAPERRGDLEAWGNRDTYPICVDIESLGGGIDPG